MREKENTTVSISRFSVRGIGSKHRSQLPTGRKWHEGTMTSSPYFFLFFFHSLNEAIKIQEGKLRHFQRREEKKWERNKDRERKRRLILHFWILFSLFFFFFIYNFIWYPTSLFFWGVAGEFKSKLFFFEVSGRNSLSLLSAGPKRGNFGWYKNAGAW